MAATAVLDGAHGTVEVRGEVYFPRSEFQKCNEARAAKDLPTYANPRNTAAGFSPVLAWAMK